MRAIVQGRPAKMKGPWGPSRDGTPGRNSPQSSAAHRASNSSSKKNFSSPKAGRRSSSQVARSSWRAKKGHCTQSGLRPWMKRSANTRSPTISVTPWISILPGAALMDGPRAVRPRPETCCIASR